MKFRGIDAGVGPSGDDRFETGLGDGLGQDLEPCTVAMINVETSEADLNNGHRLERSIKTDLNDEATSDFDIGL